MMEEIFKKHLSAFSIDAGGSARTRIYENEINNVNIVGAGSKPARKKNGVLKTGAGLEERLWRRRLE